METGKALRLDLVILELEEGIAYQEGAIIALVRSRKHSFEKVPQADASRDLGYIVAYNSHFTTSSFHLNGDAIAPVLQQRLLVSLREKRLIPERYNGHLSLTIFYEESEIASLKGITPLYR